MYYRKPRSKQAAFSRDDKKKHNQKIFRKENDTIHPLNADIILISNYLSYISLALTIEIDTHVVTSKDWDLNITT